MRYRSTRGTPGQSSLDATFRTILLEGLAADGGLYVPDHYPQVDQATLGRWRRLLRTDGYPAVAAEVMGLFADDYEAETLRALCAQAYTVEKFEDEQIVPVIPLGDPADNRWLARLSNGPTAAFKDIAMQMLGELLSYELAARADWITILGATSGDTGSSAEYALRGRDGIEVVMLTPAGRVTRFQQAQMFGLTDPNIINVAVQGVFDDCQDLVKAVNADAAFKATWHIGAVNSINWARVAAQVVYYIVSWLRVTSADDEQVSFAVPTGNFGNILAGHVARQMGVPIDRLILATNENDVLDEFFRTGVYRVRTSAQTVATSSPSMDISKASNLERLVFDLLDADAARVRQLFADELPRTGQFDLSGTEQFRMLPQRFGFLSAASTHADRIATIRRLWQGYAQLIDPHTANAVHAATVLADQVDTPIVVLETALPIKFADTIREATGMAPDIPLRFAGIEGRPWRVVDLPNDVDALKELIRQRVPRH